jgi:hypothetical protein
MVGLEKNWKPSFIKAGRELKTTAVPRRIIYPSLEQSEQGEYMSFTKK